MGIPRPVYASHSISEDFKPSVRLRLFALSLIQHPTLRAKLAQCKHRHGKLQAGGTAAQYPIRTAAGHNPSSQWYDCAFRSESTCVTSSCALRAVGHNQPTEHKSLIVQRLQAVAAALLSIRLCITRCRRKRPHAVAQHVIVPLKAPNHNQPETDINQHQIPAIEAVVIRN